MGTLLRLSEAVDWLNARFGQLANLLVLLACLVSAGNAMSRYAFSLSSNGFLEIQWYMFAVMVMLGTSYTLRRNEHVRVEIFYNSSVGAWTALARPDRHDPVPGSELLFDGRAVLALFPAIL